jgi:hypothetical protein
MVLRLATEGPSAALGITPAARGSEGKGGGGVAHRRGWSRGRTAQRRGGAVMRWCRAVQRGYASVDDRGASSVKTLRRWRRCPPPRALLLLLLLSSGAATVD